MLIEVSIAGCWSPSSWLWVNYFPSQVFFFLISVLLAHKPITPKDLIVSSRLSVKPLSTARPSALYKYTFLRALSLFLSRGSSYYFAFISSFSGSSWWSIQGESSVNWDDPRNLEERALVNARARNALPSFIRSEKTRVPRFTKRMFDTLDNKGVDVGGKIVQMSTHSVKKGLPPTWS